MKKWVGTILLLSFMACNNPSKEPTVYKTTGTIERLDPALDSVISPNAKAEIIADGFDWCEGPLWLEKQQALIFSDVPKNIIYKWTENKGKEIYLTPSGYTDTIKRGGEMGSNGLLLDNDGHLVLCQDGNRCMGRMNATLDDPKPDFTIIAATYDHKRFSSPNDAAYNSKGELFFTDPPYGLESKSDTDPKKELPFNGVFKVRTDGQVLLLIDSLPRPNGIAFFPGEKKLLISCSDPAKPNWYIYDVKGDSLTNGKIFFSAAGYDKSLKGLPDGLKIDKKGNIFATGPGGVWIFNTKAKLLGKIKMENAASNCALSADEKTLYVTNDMNVLRIKLKE